MKRPVIGVMGNFARDPHSAVAAQTTYVNTAYLDAVSKNGGTPFMLPAAGDEKELRQLLALCDGLLFPGGEDVDPKLFGEAPHPSIGAVHEGSDRFWMVACRIAEEMALPVLGICRGMQLVNVALGGSLWQDISLFQTEHELHRQRQNRDYPIHLVKTEPGSRLSEWLGEEIYTNTLHHQCVRKAGKGLFITAYAQDGVPEAMESSDGRVILVQWHPEELLQTVPVMNRLFSNLTEQACMSK